MLSVSASRLFLICTVFLSCFLTSCDGRILDAIAVCDAVSMVEHNLSF
jgi:hypothetical protein